MLPVPFPPARTVAKDQEQQAPRKVGTVQNRAWRDLHQTRQEMNGQTRTYAFARSFVSRSAIGFNPASSIHRGLLQAVILPALSSSVWSERQHPDCTPEETRGFAFEAESAFHKPR